MRLLIVNSHGADTRQGGTEKHIRRLSMRISDEGFDAYVLSAFDQPDQGSVPTFVLHHGARADGVVQRIANVARDSASLPWRRFSRLLARIQPHVVNTHNLPGIGTGIWEASRRLGIPVVHTIHDYQFMCRRVTLMRSDLQACEPKFFPCRLRTRGMLRWGAGVSQLVAGTEFAMAMHDGMFPLAQRHVIPNPFDDLPARPKPPSRELRSVGYIGSLHPNKGVLELLKAAPRLAEIGIAVHIAGSGALAQQVKAAARIGQIRYFGHVSGDEKLAFLRSCDAGVMPSIWMEPGGPPNALLEWLGSGRPVLSSGRGCLAEAHERFRGCIAVEPSAPNLVAAISMLRDPTLWNEALAAVDAVSFPNDEARWIRAYGDLYRLAAS